MIYLTANYTNTNHNFVIQNLDYERAENKYLPSICIVNNILQRGKPTLMSTFLQSKVGSIHKEDDFDLRLALIDSEPPKWQRIIRGDEKNNYIPAQKFFEKLIPKYLSGYKFIQQLILPEVPISEITKNYVDEFAEMQVDFYLPQAFLIIEIDGSHHDSSLDAKRDDYTSKYGIKTVRIKTKDLEAENKTFINKIGEIEKHIKEVENEPLQIKFNRDNNRNPITLSDYKDAFQNIDLSKASYLATAIIRFQLTVLRLLEIGYLSLSEDDWAFEIFDHDIKGYAELAIEDLFIWFSKILQLQKIEFNFPKVRIKHMESEDAFSNNSTDIQINFSLLKRYTDEFQLNKSIIYVRNDYMDKYKVFKKGNSRDKLRLVGYKDYDYFKVSTTTVFDYQISLNDENTDKEPLKYLLWEIFLQSNKNLTYETLEFFEGQLEIITNALSRKDTIGLLPTGSGKSVCFQLSAILQPAISFVVCPIISLMYDQKADLENAFLTRINHITSDDDGEDKTMIQREFQEGKYFFIYISPERFQIKSFRHYLSEVNKKFDIAYAVIDEVHCLSEWGHDFRTSYLNLAKTIDKLCPNAKYIGLTATASINVLKDVCIEFNIDEVNVKTPSNYAREELDFYVIEDEGAKLDALLDELNKLDNQMGILNTSEKDTKCGIIFTQTISHKKTGCYPLSDLLTKKLGSEVGYFSGSIPENEKKPIMSKESFQEYKIETQKKFKSNKLKLIVATKAFGMGVNKNNIYYTIHYGIPPSMEALYQEAGRAGRDKKIFRDEKAKCCVLFTKSIDENILDELWATETFPNKLKQLLKQVQGDINTNLFIFTSNMESLKVEAKFIIDLYSVSRPKAKDMVIIGSRFRASKAKVEKAIYRLSLLGIIEDWTIRDFFGGGIFEVDYNDYDENSIRVSLENNLRKYDADFSLDKLNSETENPKYKEILNSDLSKTEKCIYLLVYWSYYNITNNRRQSLKNIYENCCKASDGTISKEDFKKNLEDYFKINERSVNLKNIAENLIDHTKWLEIFYGPNRSLIKTDELESLKNNLSRFLESYMHNTGLDLVSGLLRLLLDDHNNADGKNRLEISLKKITNFENKMKAEILMNILEIGEKMDHKNRLNLSESLCKYFNDNKSIIGMHKSLGDENSAYYYLENANTKLSDIRRVIYGKFR